MTLASTVTNQGQVRFMTYTGTLTAVVFLAFLKQLRRHIPGPVTVVWDRSNIHDRSKAVRAYLAGHPEIETEKFPGYAPEANPNEPAVKPGIVPDT